MSRLIKRASATNRMAPNWHRSGLRRNRDRPIRLWKTRRSWQLPAAMFCFSRFSDMRQSTGRIHTATFTLIVQVVPCVTEHTVTTCKMRPGLGSVLDLADIRATRHTLLPVIQTALRVLIAFSSRSFAGSSALLPWATTPGWKKRTETYVRLLRGGLIVRRRTGARPDTVEAV